MNTPAPSRRPIRIAFCHYTADVCGGSDRSLFDLVTHLPRERFDPIMILKRGDPIALEYEKAGIEARQVRLAPPRRAFEARKLAAFFLWYWPSVIQVARIICSLKTDLVHVNTLNNLQGPVAARLARRPLVWHVRELGKGSLVDRMMIGLAARLANRIVAISPAVGHSLAACGNRVRVIPNGIDLGEYRNLPERAAARMACGFPAEGVIVTSIGRLEPWKGQHVFVEAVPAIVRAQPNAHIFIVGGAAVNKPEYLSSLEARCRQLGIHDHVTFTGIRRDIPLILAATDVHVLPTMTAEPFGRTIVEAMAAGCPVVATDAGGPRDIVVHGETGWLVPPGNANALAEKVCRLLANPGEARRMGAAGRQRAAEQFSLERLVRDMTALFEELAERQG